MAPEQSQKRKQPAEEDPLVDAGTDSDDPMTNTPLGVRQSMMEMATPKKKALTAKKRKTGPADDNDNGTLASAQTKGKRNKAKANVATTEVGKTVRERFEAAKAVLEAKRDMEKAAMLEAGHQPKLPLAKHGVYVVDMKVTETASRVAGYLNLYCCSQLESLHRLMEVHFDRYMTLLKVRVSP
jgi:hypothetical protein